METGKILTAKEIIEDIQQSYKEVSSAYLIILEQRIKKYAEQQSAKLLKILNKIIDKHKKAKTTEDLYDVCSAIREAKKIIKFE